MFIFLFGIFLHIYLTAALQVRNLTILEKKMEVWNGTRLLIPCHFETNMPFAPRELRVEWRVSKLNASHLPILRIIDTMVEPVPQPNDYNSRAQMYVSHIPDGNCSLVINPVHQNDSGTYEVQLSTNSETEADQTQQVEIVVSERKDTLPGPGEDLTDERKEETSGEESADNQPEERAGEKDWLEAAIQVTKTPLTVTKEVDTKLMNFTMELYFFLRQNRAWLIFLAILMVTLFLLFVLGSVAGLIFGIRYFKLKKEKIDKEWDIPLETSPFRSESPPVATETSSSRPETPPVAKETTPFPTKIDWKTPREGFLQSQKQSNYMDKGS
ncbi:uncharacterized protein LOC115100672 isoform X2 [Rhinatrema bivittatum]|uniref:uncharacterized protein LOC115100672 isoform X2 n=1 Tax=Rhinatrema bivittatum TaxID=194408 RepID=UPI00112C5F98|nr:uncharacterized protein LOC115100672 isoform X2 [Rhinatrema bivittatum]